MRPSDVEFSTVRPQLCSDPAYTKKVLANLAEGKHKRNRATSKQPTAEAEDEEGTETDGEECSDCLAKDEEIGKLKKEMANLKASAAKKSTSNTTSGNKAVKISDIPKAVLEAHDATVLRKGTDKAVQKAVQDATEELEEQLQSAHDENTKLRVESGQRAAILEFIKATGVCKDLPEHFFKGL